jgi:CheY-like chemotaxis protein
VSEPGKGTTVHILLPCAEGMADIAIDPPPAEREEEQPSGKSTVLVVEDEEPLRQAVLKMLRREGFEVYEASNGSAAIGLIRAIGGQIDLILLDMTIPGAPSAEVIAEAARIRPHIKVIATSAYSEEMLMDKISALEVYGFIRKPFRIADLVKVLQAAVLS